MAFQNDDDDDDEKRGAPPPPVINFADIECKIRGFTMDEQDSALLNFDSMKRHIFAQIKNPGDESQTIAVPVSINMDKNRTTKKVCLTPKVKKYRLVFDKRVIQTEDCSSRPRFFFFVFYYRATREQLRREPGAWTFFVSSPNKEKCNHCARILHHQLCIDDLVTYCKYSPFQRGFRFQFWLLEARSKCYDLYSDSFFLNEVMNRISGFLN